MNTTLIVILIGNLYVTSYRSVKNQTDSSPYRTSTNERVCPDGVAVSQDLICGACKRLHKRCEHPENAGVHYGDWVYIQNIGFKRVNDVMHERFRNRMDVWVGTLKAEKEFHKKFKYETLDVFKFREEQ